MKVMNNASYCIFFYGLDAFGQILYMIPRLIIFLLDLMGLPAYKWETSLWEWLEKIDRWLIDNINIHIIHFSKIDSRHLFQLQTFKTNRICK